MKRLFLALLLLAAPLAVLNTGCQTTRQELAYKSIKTTWETVHASMQAYADLRVAGKVDDVAHAKVLDLHQKYQASMDLAIVTGGLDWMDPPTADLQEVAGKLIGLISTLRK